MIKFCKDCKWCYDPDKGKYNFQYAFCRAPQNPKVKRPPLDAEDLVSGTIPQTDPNIEYGTKYCVTHRRYGWFDSWVLSVCGHNARWFEPKE